MEIVTPTGDVNEELSLLMISGELPDLISLGSWESSYSKLYEGGYVYALNELADQYDPYFYKVVDGSVIKWHTKEDGNLYAIPNDAYGEEQMAETGMTAATQTFLVRKDLYEDMGSPDMTTPGRLSGSAAPAEKRLQHLQGRGDHPVLCPGRFRLWAVHLPAEFPCRAI